MDLKIQGLSSREIAEKMGTLRTPAAIMTRLRGGLPPVNGEKVKVQMNNCLRCHRPFLSRGNFNRLCGCPEDWGWE